MIRILLISDIHQNNNVLKNVEIFLKKNKVQAIIVAGDLTDRNYGSLDFAKKFVKIFEKECVKIFYIPGNNDHQGVIDFFETKKMSINLKQIKYKGHNIIGIGGFGDAIPNVNLKDSILITHYPPISTGKAFKDHPKVHIFGHTHFREYKKVQNNTLLIQLKAAILNSAAILELPSLDVKFIKIK